MPKSLQRVSSFKPKKLISSLGLIVGAVLIFLAGIQVGNGNFRFGKVTTETANKSLPANLNYTSVEEVYDKLKSRFDGTLDANKLIDGLKAGLVGAAGDTYTEYMDAKEASDFEQQLDGTFSGIGAELDKRNDMVIVLAPIAGSPAEKSGLRSKDIIAEVDGETTANKTLQEVINKIRGKEGTDVTLTVYRENSDKLTITITRAVITIPSVEYKVLDGSIGYIKISRFGDDTTALATKAANELKSKNVTSVILDLRGDPGGLLSAAVDVSSLWLPRSKVVLQEKRDGKVIDTLTSTGTATLKGIKTIVLIDEGSASASEITAGALKDNGAATLVGVKSFGKGSVQQIEKLGPQNDPTGLLKVTVARWYTPNGRNIDKEGIAPDVEVKRTLAEFQADKDPQLDKAKELAGE